MKNIIKYIFVIVFIIAANRCGNSDQHKLNQINKDIINDSLSPVLNNNIEYLLPSPEELFDIIFKEKIHYESTLILDHDIEKKIVNSNLKALLLGAYIADFSYSLLYLDYINCSKTLENIKSISEEIGVGNTYHKKFFKRIESNLGNLDSLNTIYKDFSSSSFNALAESSSHEILSIIAIGVYLETIYIGYNTLHTKTMSNPVRVFLIEQRMIFDNFYLNYTNYNSQKEDLKAFNTGLPVATFIPTYIFAGSTAEVSNAAASFPPREVN